MKLLKLLLLYVSCFFSWSLSAQDTIYCSPGDDLSEVIQSNRTIILSAGRYSQLLDINASNVNIIGAHDSVDVEFWRIGAQIGGRNIQLQNIIFRQTPNSAIAIGKGSEFVVVDKCKFFACGTDKGGVTLWLGDSTRNCTIKNCLFDIQNLQAQRHFNNQSHVYDIAIMCSENKCTNHLFNNNQIYNYGYGIQVGISGANLNEGFHTISNNYIDHPTTDGIHIKAAKCIVKNNTVYANKKFSITARAGYGTIIENNTITDGYLGIRILSKDHKVLKNKIERMRSVGIYLAPAKKGGYAAENIEVIGNTILDCGGADINLPNLNCAGILIGNDLTQKIGKNTVIGEGKSIDYGHIGVK